MPSEDFDIDVEVSLGLLRENGHSIGPASLNKGKVYVAIDGVPRTFDDIFRMAEDLDQKGRRQSA